MNNQIYKSDVNNETSRNENELHQQLQTYSYGIEDQQEYAVNEDKGVSTEPTMNNDSPGAIFVNPDQKEELKHLLYFKA